MAEAAPVVAAACKCFGAEVGHAANMEDRLKKLSEKAEELSSLKKDVQKVVDDAPKAGREPTEVAIGWLKRADSIIRRADSAMAKAEEKQQQHEQEEDGQGCCVLSLWRYKSGKRITKVTKEVIRHEEKGKELKILHDEQAKPAAKEDIKPAQLAAAAGGKAEDVNALTPSMEKRRPPYVASTASNVGERMSS